uniref:Uncharacterized protein n=1 Tax=Panagrolaimus davidi TaxID=227884 RepID=A0A914Q321_9BILA
MFLHGTAATNSIVAENYEEKEKSQSWNKSPKVSTFTTLNEDNNDLKKRWKNENTLNTTNKSTLSLHIEAYENSIKAVQLKHKQNPFELPRQQNQDHKNEPEVMQFKASQKLLDSNKPKSELKPNDEKDPTLFMPVKAELKPAVCSDRGEENHRINDEARVATQNSYLDERAAHDLGAKAQKITIRKNRIPSTKSSSSSENENGIRQAIIEPPVVEHANNLQADQVLPVESPPPDPLPRPNLDNYQHSPMRVPTPLPSRYNIRSHSVNRGNNSTFINTASAAGTSITIRSQSFPTQSRRRRSRR